MPKVSILMPVYKVEKYLEQCLKSVIAQTFHDIEIICINNGAGEIERKILEEYSSKDNRIKVIHFEKNQGYGKAINSGLEIASGEYIGIVESDDYISSTMYEELYHKAIENNSDIVKSRYFSLINNNVKIGLENLNVINSNLFAIEENPEFLREHPSIWSCIYKTDFLKENNIKFIETKNTGWVDNPFQVETFILSKKISFIETPLYYYREGHSGTSSSLGEGILTPYKASVCVNEILNKHTIQNKEILFNLSFRQFSYIKIVLQKMDRSNKNLAQEAINGLFDLIGSNLDTNKKFLKFRKKYYKKDLKFHLLKLEIKKFYKNIINNMIEGSRK